MHLGGVVRYVVDGGLASQNRPSVALDREDCTATATIVAVVEQGKRHEVGQSLEPLESIGTVSHEALPKAATVSCQLRCSGA